MKKLIPLLLCASMLAGCGGSDDTGFSGSPVPPVPAPLTDEQRIQQAQVADVDTTMDLVPLGHLDTPPLTIAPKGKPLSISVAELQTGYEIIFGSLSAKYKVTLSTKEVVQDIDFIKSQSGTGNFDLLAKPIQNNKVGVTDVSFQPVEYQTTVVLPSGPATFGVSGGLLMPTGITKSQLKGVIVYFHGTTTNNEQVGSDYVTNGETQLCAQVFASQGYIVVIPDYIGQGINYQTVHPYVLYPTVSAKTAADMLTAVQPLITEQYGFVEGDPALKLFSTGYSEGGAYSLWFHTFLSQNAPSAFYKLTHSVGIEGAYSTSDVTQNFILSEVDASSPNTFNIQSQTLVNLAKPILSADAFLSYAAYTLNSDFSSVFQTDFFNMKATPPNPQDNCNVNGQQLTIAQAFRLPATDLSTELVWSAFDKSSNDETYTGAFSSLTSTDNSAKALLSTTFFTSPFQTQLQQVLQAANVNLSAVPDQAVSIISLNQDSVVSPNNFDVLLAAYPSKIKNAIKIDQNSLYVLSPFSDIIGSAYWTSPDHQNVPPYAFLYALNIFNGF